MPSRLDSQTNFNQHLGRRSRTHHIATFASHGHSFIPLFAIPVNGVSVRVRSRWGFRKGTVIPNRRYPDDERLIRSEQLTVLEEIFNANERDQESFLRVMRRRFLAASRVETRFHQFRFGLSVVQYFRLLAFK